MNLSPYTHASEPRPDCEYCGAKGTGLICIDCSKHRDEILERCCCPECYSPRIDYWTYQNKELLSAWVCADCGQVWYDKWFPDEEAKMVLPDNVTVIDVPGSRKAASISRLSYQENKVVIIRGNPPCPECGNFLTIDTGAKYPVVCEGCGTEWSIEDFVDIATRDFEEG